MERTSRRDGGLRSRTRLPAAGRAPFPAPVRASPRFGRRPEIYLLDFHLHPSLDQLDRAEILDLGFPPPRASFALGAIPRANELPDRLHRPIRRHFAEVDGRDGGDADLLVRGFVVGRAGCSRGGEGEEGSGRGDSWWRDVWTRRAVVRESNAAIEVLEGVALGAPKDAVSSGAFLLPREDVPAVPRPR